MDTLVSDQYSIGLSSLLCPEPCSTVFPSKLQESCYNDVDQLRVKLPMNILSLKDIGV